MDAADILVYVWRPLYTAKVVVYSILLLLGVPASALQTHYLDLSGIFRYLSFLPLVSSGKVVVRPYSVFICYCYSQCSVVVVVAVVAAAMPLQLYCEVVRVKKTAKERKHRKITKKLEDSLSLSLCPYL